MLTKQIEVTTYDAKAGKEQTYTITIRELLGGEKRRQRDTGPGSPPVYVDELLIENGIDPAIVEAMPSSEERRVMTEIWTLSGYPPPDVEEEAEQGNS